MNMIAVSLAVLLSIALIVTLTSVVRFNAFASLFAVALLLALVVLPEGKAIEILKQGFGNTLASIGFLIVFGAIIAGVLEKTGGALSIANALLARTGNRKAASAMGVAGFIVGIPIFCDSGYIVMSGWAKSFGAKAQVALPFISFVLATSLYSVHCLIPTHPGALAASQILNADLGWLIPAATLLAVPPAAAAFYWIRRRTEKIRNSPPPEPAAEEIDPKALPPVWLSLLPVLIPILLISLGSLLAVLKVSGSNAVVSVLTFVGQPIAALLVGVLLSLLLLKRTSVKEVNSILEAAIEKAGPILIVTGAGGMFGSVIKETGVGAFAGDFFVQTGLGLAVPFLIASILKTAQGSSTVAIITAASLIAPMLPALGLESETGKILAMLSMGAGSMMVSHANDSYFWVVSRFSGIGSEITLKAYSTATVVMGTVAFLCVWGVSLFIL